MSSVQNEAPRRPLATREKRWAKDAAAALNRMGVSPNAISVASLVFAIVAGIALWQSGLHQGAQRIAFLLLAGAMIQLRLLCNMLDGMVAIEGGRRTAYGELYNDMPDRFADLAILAGAGYGLTAFPWGRDLGWIAGALAVLTAYVRLLGGAMGARQYFSGPMAKPHRMAVVTVACVLSCFEPLAGWNGQVMALALAIVALGSAVTIVRRTAQIAGEIASR
jgi:phosphatidylglycerophosphate synthase